MPENKEEVEEMENPIPKRKKKKEKKNQQWPSILHQ